MFAIYKRELKAFFQSIIGWLFIAATLFLSGVYFQAINVMSGYTSVALTVNNALFIYLFTIPILTMRILTEEKKQKIDQLTFTAPVSIGKIVLGKYLAMATVLTIPVLIICTYPIVMSNFGIIPFAMNYVAILGYYLYGLAAIAMCLFLSSFTESQVISAIVSFAFMFISYMMTAIQGMLTDSENAIGEFIAKILSAIDFSSRFSSLLNGIFDVTSVFYFISFAALCLFLTTQSIQKRRYSMSVKNISLGAYSLGMVAVVTVVVIVANLTLGALPAKYINIDVTNNKLFSLTDTTKDFLEGLDSDITIYVLNAENYKDETLSNTLDQYTENSKHIKVVYEDPSKNPTFYKQYTDTALSYNSMIVVGDKRSIAIEYNDLFYTEINYETYQEEVLGYDAEGQITSALNYVTMDSTPKAYMTMGHNEYSLDEGFASSIKKQNIEVSTINLVNEEIPEDAEFLMILGPEDDFTAAETQKVIDYCTNGGQLIATIPIVESVKTKLPNFQKILDVYNVSSVDGIIVENDPNNIYNTPLMLLPNVSNTNLTSGVYNNKLLFAPYAKGITVTEDDNVTLSSLVTTSESAFSKLDIENLTSYDKDETAISGPFDIGVFVQRQNDANPSFAFFFGSPNMFTDQADEVVVSGNSMLFMNCVNKCIDTEVGVVAVPVKPYNTERIAVNQIHTLWLCIVYIILLPVGSFAAGIVLWVIRRRK